jgi:hypothetical protein
MPSAHITSPFLVLPMLAIFLAWRNAENAELNAAKPPLVFSGFIQLTIVRSLCDP